MLKKEDIDSWNSLFPDCEIRTNDLSNPTETFLTKALVVYLKRFGYKVEPPFVLGDGKENNKENRAFLMKLARQTDEMLKITDKSFTFTYIDLMCPTPRKTSNVLHILLNYLFFYNMFREEIYVMANDRILQLQDLKTRLDNARKENESRLNQAAAAQKTMETLSTDLSAIQEELTAVKQTRHAKIDELNKLKVEVDELKVELNALQEEKRTMNKTYVSDEEAEELKRQLATMQSSLELLRKREAKMENALKEHKAEIVKLQKKKKDTELAMNIFPLSLIETLKESKKELESVQQINLQMENKQEDLSKQIGELTGKLNDMELQYETMKNKSDEKFNEQQKEIEILEKHLVEKNLQLEQLTQRENELQKQLEEQREIKEYLMENFAELLLPYSSD